MIREDRNNQMVARMQAAGVDITFEKLHAKEGIGVLTRANFAGYLLSVGFVKSIKEAFDRYLGDGKPFYIPAPKLLRKKPSNSSNRLTLNPVLAHPMLYKLGKNTSKKYVKMMTDWGLEAMESATPPIPSDDLYLSHLANHYHLKYSGGSDFHGTYKPHIQIGTGKGRLVVPYDILEKLRA